MKRFLFSLFAVPFVLLVLLTIPRGEAAVLGDLVAERVVTLPEDGQAWATIVFTSDAWQTVHNERTLLAWFETNPRLAALKATTKFTHITAGDPVYSHVPVNKTDGGSAYSFAHIVRDDFPCLIVQTCDGTKVYKIGGSNMPKRSSALADAVAAAVRHSKREYGLALSTSTDRTDRRDASEWKVNGKFFPLRPRPQPKPDVCPATPAVAPAATTAVTVGPPMIPDDADKEEEAEPEHVPWGLVALLGVAGFLATVGIMFSKAVNS